jgi:colanic acid biosynthesis glycosyl transferase WcaI
MRLIVHDFTGHPFQVQLSRALAESGHHVLHLYSANFATPHGALERRAEDPPGFLVEAIDLGRPFDKYGLLRRRRDERQYGRLLARRIAAFGPDCVLSGNTPLGAQALALDAAHASRARFVFWVQDLLSVGIGNAVRRKLPMAGQLIAWHYGRLEARVLRQSDEVVVISDDFRPALRDWGVAERRVHTIENWAPLEELPQRPKQNEWSREHRLAGNFCFVYSGTLGFKHRPELLILLAEEFRAHSEVRVVVVSEGLGADWIVRERRARELDNVLVLPFQPYERLADVLASADVLVTVLEEEAAAYSVPSKVLSYLCAGRPILGAIPPANLASRLIRQTCAGLVVAPRDTQAFVAAAHDLHTGPARRTELGANGRRYAETAFDIDSIASTFEQVVRGHADRHG